MKELSPQRISKKVLLGTMMGDSMTVASSHTKAYFKMAHGVDQIHYLMWKMNVLYPLVKDFRINFFGGGPFEKWNAKKRIQAYSLNSSYLRHIHDDFYSEGKKVVRINVLRRMDEYSLAAWYMDDGSLAKANGKITGVHLHTENYGRDEQEIIIQYFMEQWRIHLVSSESKKNNKVYYYLRANKEDAENFLALVKPFICSSMMYKIDPSCQSMEHSNESDDIVRTLQGCKEFIRNDKPCRERMELTDDELRLIAQYIETNKANFCVVNHWRQKSPITWFRVVGDLEVMNLIKSGFGGCINFDSRQWRYQTTENIARQIVSSVKPFLKTRKFSHLCM